MKIVNLHVAKSGIKPDVLPIIFYERNDGGMFDRTQLQNCRTASVTTCDKKSLIDIRDIKIDTSQPTHNRMVSFVEQIRNPYLFKVGDTVVKVDYEGGKEFSKVFTDLLCVG